MPVIGSEEMTVYGIKPSDPTGPLRRSFRVK
jgi:hypothetical protein